MSTNPPTTYIVVLYFSKMSKLKKQAFLKNPFQVARLELIRVCISEIVSMYSCSWHKSEYHCKLNYNSEIKAQK